MTSTDEVTDKREPFALLLCRWDCKLVRLLWKPVGGSSTITETYLMTQQSHSEEPQNISFKAHVHPYVHCCVIYNSQDVEAT